MQTGASRVRVVASSVEYVTSASPATKKVHVTCLFTDLIQKWRSVASSFQLPASRFPLPAPANRTMLHPGSRLRLRRRWHQSGHIHHNQVIPAPDHAARLDEIARGAMLKYGLQPDWPREALAELGRLRSDGKTGARDL